ncbi:6692_t:CDS:1, partial [Acaulospora colombiana]
MAPSNMKVDPSHHLFCRSAQLRPLRRPNSPSSLPSTAGCAVANTVSHLNWWQDINQQEAPDAKLSALNT